MLELGKRQTLKIVKRTDFGVYLAEEGAEAKSLIQNGLVKVNGETEYQRGKKLYDGDIVFFNGEEIKITK